MKAKWIRYRGQFYAWLPIPGWALFFGGSWGRDHPVAVGLWIGPDEDDTPSIGLGLGWASLVVEFHRRHAGRPTS